MLVGGCQLTMANVGGWVPVGYGQCQLGRDKQNFWHQNRPWLHQLLKFVAKDFKYLWVFNSTGTLSACTEVSSLVKSAQPAIQGSFLVLLFYSPNLECAHCGTTWPLCTHCGSICILNAQCGIICTLCILLKKLAYVWILGCLTL